MPIKSPRFPSGTWNLRSALSVLDAQLPHGQAPRRTPHQDHMTYTVKPLRCIGVPDGDGLTIAHPDHHRLVTQVRLLGIDAPEMHGRHGHPEHWAHESRAALAEIAVGRNIRLKLLVAPTRCKFGRLLAFAFIDGYPMSLQERQVWMGHAYHYVNFSHPGTESLAHYQAEARHAKRGLWEALRFGDMPKWAQRREKSRPGRPEIPRP